MRTLVITVLAYATLVLLLRSFGKRSLSKMNAFDFIVTVALGSTLATVALNKNVALADGALAFFLLLLLQYIITWLSVRTKAVKALVTSTPSLLYYKGTLLQDAMKKERITEDELHAKAREKGYSSLAAIEAIVLETTGELSVITYLQNGTDSLQHVKYYKQQATVKSSPH